MKGVILSLVTLFIMIGCCTTKKVQYVPVQGETIIEYRDSIVRGIDTIKVEVPREVIKEVMPIIDTSKLETYVAKSVAYVDRNKNKLVHTLENKKTQLEAKIDTVVVVEYKTEYQNKEIPVEVPVEVPYIPNWMWGVCIYAALTVGILLMKIIGKFR